ncbi:hypothetical protein ACHAWF_017121 [Thalassiosira exigua]
MQEKGGVQGRRRPGRFENDRRGRRDREGRDRPPQLRLGNYQQRLHDLSSRANVDLVEASRAGHGGHGMGDTHPSDDVLERSEVLLETEVFVVSNEECEQSSGMVGGGAVLEDGTIVGQWPETYEGKITDNRSGRLDTQADCWSSDQAPKTSRAIDPGGGGYAQAKNAAAEWTTISKEEFAFRYGMFSHGVDHAKYYTNAMGRSGVVRVEGGAGGSLTSNIISLEHNPFSRLRVVFSFCAIRLESDDDKLCVDYELNDGSIAADKCWSGLQAFEIDRWYDDMSFEFLLSSAKSMKI